MSCTNDIYEVISTEWKFLINAVENEDDHYISL